MYYVLVISVKFKAVSFGRNNVILTSGPLRTFTLKVWDKDTNLRLFQRGVILLHILNNHMFL